ncbi:MAG: ubiquitin-like domain-containing protein, partial [Vulcanimicrobiaceae bacterium]
MLSERNRRAATFLAFGFSVVGAAFAIAHSPATVAASISPETGLVGTVPETGPMRRVRFESDGRITTYLTHATTVGRFLADRGIDVGPSDYLSVDQTAVVGDDMTISYRSAYPVTLRTGDHSRILLTSARTVAELLAQADVKLAADDTVHPGLDSTPAAGETIRVERITSWVKTLRKEIAASTKVRFDPALAPGKTRVLSRGSNGLSLVTYRITRHGDAKPV